VSTSGTAGISSLASIAVGMCRRNGLRLVCFLGNGSTSLSSAPPAFVVRNEAYANAETGVIVAGVNPVNPRYSVVVATGLNAASPLRTAPRLATVRRAAEVVIFRKEGMPRYLVMPEKTTETKAE
jgi:hypothetical protein